MQVEELFLRTVEDLRDRVQEGDEYALIRATALLRQLILDGANLVDQVNRAHKLKIRYTVCGKKFSEHILARKPALFSSLGGIHVSGLFAHQREECTREQFLKTIVLSVGGHTFTIQDLIDHAAHVAGGVHAGSARNDRERVLSEFRGLIIREPTQQLTPQIVELRGISLIVLDAIEPLRQKVIAAAGSTV
jgi:hypothetical protein